MIIGCEEVANTGTRCRCGAWNKLYVHVLLLHVLEDVFLQREDASLRIELCRSANPGSFGWVPKHDWATCSYDWIAHTPWCSFTSTKPTTDYQIAPTLILKVKKEKQSEPRGHDDWQNKKEPRVVATTRRHTMSELSVLLKQQQLPANDEENDGTNRMYTDS